MSMEINPVFTPPPPPPPPKVTGGPAIAPAAPPAGAPAGSLGEDRFGGADDPYGGLDDPTGQAPTGPTVPANGSRLIAIADDQAFVEQAFREMFDHPVVTPEELAAAQRDPDHPNSRNAIWRESLVRDNLAHLKAFMAQGQSPAQARRTLLEGLMQTDEFKQHAGVRANHIDLGLPIQLVGPNGQPIPVLWHSQATFQSRGDQAFYHGDAGLPLDRPLSFDEGNRFLENFICNGTSAYAMADRSLAATPQEHALADLGEALYGAYWGRKDGDDQGKWTAFITEKKGALDDLVMQHPELAPRAAQTQAVLAAGLAFMENVQQSGRALLLQSVPGAKTGFYMSEPKGLNPRGPLDERVVPDEGEQVPRYAQIGNYYARQTYAQQVDDPRSPVGSWVASWLT